MPTRATCVPVCLAAVLATAACGTGPVGLDDAGVSAAATLAPGSTVVYDDALRNGFVDWSWATHSLTASRPTHSGRRAVSFSPSAWAGVFFENAATVDLSRYAGLDLWIRGASPGRQQLRLLLQRGSTVLASVDVGSALAAGYVRSDAWQLGHFDFAALGVAAAIIDGIVVQDASGLTQANVYLDDVVLTPAADVPPVTPPPPPPPMAMPRLGGVDLAGADFGNQVPGTYGVNYIYPTTAEVDHFVGLGMNVIRLPFLWERLQRSQYAALDATELARLDAVVSYATGKGAYVIVDPHNYARYFGVVIGAGVPVGAYTDFWSRLAAHFAQNPRVIFGLMNEPHDMSTEVWLSDANAAIAAIRATGAPNLITVPGNGWDGAHSWLQNWYGTPNATAMLGVKDPGNNFVFEVHQYLDADSSGGDMANCVSSTIGSQRLADFDSWLAQHGLRAFLGEFGAGSGSTCLAALDDLLGFIKARPDRWLGWTYWAAGPWWGTSVSAIEPVNGVDVPQTAVLLRNLP